MSGSCKAAGCNLPHHAMGYCNGHYRRLKRTGKVEPDIPFDRSGKYNPSFKHGHCVNHYETPTFKTWSSMLHRCYNPQAQQWPNYGARGIKVCPRWFDFSEFLKDMGEKPDGLMIGRIDNDGDYEPSNCRWETPRQQQNNRRSNRRLTFNGKTDTLENWARTVNLKADTIAHRIKRGWSLEEALTLPLP